MLDFLFSDGGFSPHAYCLAWNEPLLYTHIVSDLLIAVSYFSIPAVILVFLRRRKDPSLHGPAMLFVTFISACGLTHVLGILTMFEPYYGLQGMMKLFTGVVSFVTALILWKILPAALNVPSPSALMRALDEKEAEIAERERAEHELARKKLELDQKVEELTAANSELNEFAYAASHDLKSPANTLSLWLSEFAADYKEQLDADAAESIEEVSRIVDRMRQLVEDILSYSRVVNSDLSNMEAICIDEMIDDITSDMRENIRAVDADIVVGDLPPIVGHPLLLRVLFNNLMSNALKFHQPGRKLKIELSSVQTADGYVLSFKDNGIGIEPEHHERIFSMFKRLHHPEEYEGTGLGLALCRRAVKSHGGMIEVRSTVGKGTEFLITLSTEVVHVQQAA